MTQSSRRQESFVLELPSDYETGQNDAMDEVGTLFPGDVAGEPRYKSKVKDVAEYKLDWFEEPAKIRIMPDGRVICSTAMDVESRMCD